MADEYHHSLVLLGLKLVDLHKILNAVLHNAYFTYNGRLYQQLVGLFMGCKVSPLLAIVRVYTFEKRILYVDQNYKKKFIFLFICNPSISNPGPDSPYKHKFSSTLSVFYQNIQGLIPFGNLTENHPVLDNNKLFELHTLYLQP